MTLEEFVLTYKDSEGNYVITVAEYYERYIRPLAPKFNKHSLKTNRLALCCFKSHDDVNPSLGLMNHKSYPGVKLYHCFGCGASGTVIRLHQRIQRDYYNRRLSDEDAAKELCTLFGVNTEQFKEKVYEGDYALYMKRMANIGKSLTRYDIHEFRSELRDIRCDDTLTIDNKVSKINAVMVRFIATSKKMYD